MQSKLKIGLVSALSATMLIGADINVANAEETSAPYRPQVNSDNADNRGYPDYRSYPDSTRGYRSPAPRYNRGTYGPSPYPRYRPQSSYRGNDYRRDPRRDYRGDGPWNGSRRGKSKSFNFGNNDFKPWGGNGRDSSRGMDWNFNDMIPWDSDTRLPWEGRNSKSRGVFPDRMRREMDKAWDKGINKPSKIDMPGGWSAPSLDVPGPAEVTDEFGKGVREFNKDDE